MNEESKTHFSLLSEAEKQSRLWQAEQSDTKILVWAKNQKDRISFKLKYFDKKEQLLSLIGDTSKFQISASILGSFELNGFSYFFKSKIQSQGYEDLKIDASLDFYKSERRNSFRLLTYPLFQIYLETEVAGVYKGSNIINFQSKMSQTGLFKSFLRLVDSGSAEKLNEISLLKLRVQDLSVTGLSTHIGTAELPFFKPDSVLHKIKISFPDETIEVENSKIIYIVDLIQQKDRKVKKYKMGIRFSNLGEKVDNLLSQKINRMLRDNDFNSDFEDFIK